MIIGILFGKNERNDAEHAYEVLQNEAAYYSIDMEVLNKEKLKCGKVEFQFVDIDKKEGWKKPKSKFDKIYASMEIKKEYDHVIKEKTKNITYLARPTQGIVDYVKEVEHLAKNKIVKAYRMENGEVVAEQVKEHFLNKGIYFSTKKACLSAEAEEVKIQVITEKVEQQELVLI